MITRNQVLKAMSYVGERLPLSRYPADVEQIAMTLELYRDRKEFDGTYGSAVECLELACYEIEGVNADV